MSYILFIDESGHDRTTCPYEVLAGVAIEDRDLWNLVTALAQTEEEVFGRRYSDGHRELKAKKILKSKTFRLAGQKPALTPESRRSLARAALDDGARVSGDQLTALAQAKLDFVERALVLCARFRVRAFASIVPREAPRVSPDSGGFLRKDYAYLFERFFYFVEDMSREGQGLIVFDELERSQSHILIEQMARYFQLSLKGRTRAARIVPEPFFVHSHLTTGIQLADLVAYVIAWSVRVGGMSAPARPELDPFGRLVLDLRHRTVREMGDNPNFVVWSYAVINDLRPAERQDG